MNRRALTKVVTRSITSYLVKKGYSVENELAVLPWGKRRADIVGIRLNGEICIIEVKSCKADFKSDSKYKEYLPFCNKMYIAVPPNSEWINEYKDMLKQDGIGILILNQNGVRVKQLQYATKRTMKKKVKINFLIRLSWRACLFSKRTVSGTMIKRNEDTGIDYLEMKYRSKYTALGKIK